MLATPEQIPPGLRQSEVFARMVSELPWAGLRAYLEANSQLCKLCTLGGYRLEPKHRTRFEGFVLREAEKTAFSSAFCNPVFAQWYPVHETLYKTLEDYFHSEEYKTFRQGQNLAEDAYVLLPEKFQEVFAVEELEQWRILLCFSPLQFSVEQQSAVLSTAGGNTGLVRRIAELEEQLEAARRETAQARGDVDRLKAQTEATSGELQELRKARKDLTAERNELQGKFEASQADNRKLRAAITEKEAEVRASRAQVATAQQQEKSRLDATVARLEKESADWRGRYEQQRLEYRDLKDQQTQLEANFAQIQKKLQDRDARIEHMCSFADLLLGRIDWIQAGKNLHLTPALQKQFNSVLKKLNYEGGTTPSIDAALPVFWERLMTLEKHVIDQIAQSNTLEVGSGSAEEFWENLKEPFDDVIIGIEARLMLLRLLREVFYQMLDMDALETVGLGAFLAVKK